LTAHPKQARLTRLTRLITAAAALIFAAGCPQIVVGEYPCPDAMDCSGKPPPHMGNGETAVGGPCEASSDCDNGTCVTKALLGALGVDTSHIDIPNGMCSREGCTTDSDCGDGGVCRDGSAFGNATVTLCLRACANITNCRWQEGYQCWVRDYATDPQGICLPDSVVAAYYCPTGCP
jgi:hypothetical protein